MPLFRRCDRNDAPMAQNSVRIPVEDGDGLPVGTLAMPIGARPRSLAPVVFRVAAETAAFLVPCGFVVSSVNALPARNGNGRVPFPNRTSHPWTDGGAVSV